MGYRTRDEYLRNRNQRDYDEEGHYKKHKKNNPGGFRDDDYAATDYLSEKQNSPYGDTDHGYNNRSYPDADGETLEARRYWQNRDRFAQGRYANSDRYSVDRNYVTDRDHFGAHDHEHNDRFARGADHALNDYRTPRSHGERYGSTRNYSAPFEPTIDTPGYFTGANSGQVWERTPSFRDSSNTMDHPHDPDYWAWRNAELSRHDNAYSDWRRTQAETYDTHYNEWRKTRQDKFAKDFTDWRSSQAQSATPTADAGKLQDSSKNTSK